MHPYGFAICDPQFEMSWKFLGCVEDGPREHQPSLSSKKAFETSRKV